MSTDFYAVLGIGRDASDEDIKRAYRRLARELHPDANPGDPEAEARFKEVSQAYEVLHDPERRRRYDLFGDDGRVGASSGPSGSAFDIGDLFDAFFGGNSFGAGGASGPRSAPDAEIVIDLDLAEAASGVTHGVDVELPGPCERCDGTGCEPGTHPARCETCAGTGQVRQVRRSLLGQLVTSSACPGCAGTGRVIPSPCRRCRGDGRLRTSRHLEIDVPAGIDDGQRLRLSGRGPAAPRGGRPGDLYVTVRVRPHPTLERHGLDLIHRRRIPLTQAVLGATIVIDTLEGPEEVTVPPGTQPGTQLRLRGKGVPALGGRGRGDLVVEIGVDIPRRLDGEQAELVHRLAQLRGEDVTLPAEGGLFSRLRSAFQ